MNICLIGPTYPFRGGISHYTTLLYEHLRSRHHVRFISFKRQYPKGLFPGKSDRDPSLRPLRVEGVSRVIDSMNPATWLRAAAMVVRDAPDLVIIPWWVSFWAPQFWTIAAVIRTCSRARILFLCHNVHEHESGGVDRFLTRRVLALGHLFVVHSEQERAALSSMMPGARIRTNAHPTYAAFDSGGADPSRIRRRYGINGNVILFFGFVRPYKGLEYLIRALPRVLSELDATLLIAGEFWRDKEAYTRLIEELGVGDRVVVVDRYIPNEEVGDFFAASDLVVQPYVSATGSGVVQLAYGFGKPVVATKVGCLPEVVQEGRTGFLVPPGSPRHLAEAILNYFQGGRALEFRHNIEEIRQRFSWDGLIDTMEGMCFE